MERQEARERRSVFGKGTEVSLLLPRSKKTPVAARESLAVAPQFKHRTVAAPSKDMFEHLGYRATQAAGAEAALGALANDRSIRLLFSDIMVPGPMNGIELAQEVRKRRPELPVLLSSGHPGPAQRQAEASGRKILSKPYRLEELAQLIETGLCPYRTASHRLTRP
jgi:CheY-like chemotaxis protein